MKFSDGQWQNRKGVNVYSPAEIRDIEVEEDKVTIYTPNHPIKHRGDTLGSPLLTITYTTPIPDVIGVKITHYQGLIEKGPEFSLNIIKSKLNFENNQDEAILKSGDLSLKLNKKGDFKAEFFYKENKLTDTGNKNGGYVTVDDKDFYMREQLSLSVGETVYGLGERFTPLVKNGQTVDMWNQDGGTNSEQTYKNIPFYVTNKGYGVFVNEPEAVSFEIGSEKVSKVQFSVPGESIEYFIIGGGSIKEVLKNYTALTGRPALPPAWTFGLWLTTSFTTSYDEKTVNSFIDGMAQRDIPLHVFHFDCFWMKEFQWCDFEWDKDVFPDPQAMLKRLKARGLKICVWINPYIGQKSKLFKEGMENGYLIKRPNGDVWQWDMWQPGMALVDFTNPAACKWYADKLEVLVDMGVDSFKTDFGERVPTDVAYFDGSDPIKMHNYYTLLYNKTVFDLLKKKYGVNKAAVFARSATVGSQMFPVHWGGDCTATYESMAESLRGGLSLCLSGFGFWSHDISGFESTATPDVYKRWAAFGLLSSHSRLHGSTSYRVPWLFDEEAVDVVRYFTKLKCSLMPYLFKSAVQASNLGLPTMRAMVIEFDDPACEYLDKQYMLGDSLLVAPIFSEDNKVKYYLPKGIWTNYLTGEKLSGGTWREEEHGFMSLPLMAHPNSIIAVGANDIKPDYDYCEGVTFQIFELEAGVIAATKVYDINGIEEAEITAEILGSQIIIKLHENTSKSWKVLLRGYENIISVKGGSFTKKALGTEIIPDKDTYQIIVNCK